MVKPDDSVPHILGLDGLWMTQKTPRFSPGDSLRMDYLKACEHLTTFFSVVNPCRLEEQLHL